MSNTVMTSTSLEGQSLTVLVQPNIISAEQARKRANGWLTMNVGHLLRAEKPNLVLTYNFQLRWQVQIFLTSPLGQIIGQVGILKLDVITGQILIDTHLANQLITQANVFLETESLSPNEIAYLPCLNAFARAM